jgi:hypothetical protein
MGKRLVSYAAATLLGGLCVIDGPAAEAGLYYGPDGRRPACRLSWGGTPEERLSRIP